ncbi:ZirU family protein [Noviluteimonas dokdonensis]|nr:ZirU family protein [Lysobacter dokdonensis]
MTLGFFVGAPAAFAEEDKKKKPVVPAANAASVEGNARDNTKKAQDKLPDIGGAAQGPNHAKAATDAMAGKLLGAAQAAAKTAQNNTSTTSTGAGDQFRNDAANAALSTGIGALQQSSNPFLQRLEGGITLDTQDIDFNIRTIGQIIGGEGKRHYLLAQLGAHDEDDRATANAGLVYRWIAPEDAWLIGANIFYDHDFDNSAHRIGVGAEVATKSTRVFANAYTPASDEWQTLKKKPDFEERAASGYDLGVAWSPSKAPGLDLTLKGTRWHGDQVDVFGSGQLFSNPFVFTTRLGYSPVPLFGIAVEHDKAMGTGTSDTKVMLNFRYQLGVPLSEQTARKNVAQRNDIRQRATDFVERENRIVTEVREKVVALTLAGPIVVNATINSDAVYTYALVVEGARDPYSFTIAGADAGLFTLVGNELRLDATQFTSAQLVEDNRFEVVVTVTDTRGRAAHKRFIIDVIDIDPDGDGLTNDEEETHGTDPNNPDTDGDGLDDKTEIDNGTDPLDPNDPNGGSTPVSVQVQFNGAALNDPPLVGSVLNAVVTCNGSGTCPPTLQYQWQIESAIGSGAYVDIAGATATTYTVQGGDQKRRIRVFVTQP